MIYKIVVTYHIYNKDASFYTSSIFCQIKLFKLIIVVLQASIDYNFYQSKNNIDIVYRKKSSEVFAPDLERSILMVSAVAFDSLKSSSKSLDPLLFQLLHNFSTSKVFSFIEKIFHKQSSFLRGVVTGGAGWVIPPPPHFNFRTKKVHQFQFQTSEILIFMSVQKLHGPEISRFLPCMLQLWLFIFSNCIREINHFTLDLLKRSDT